MVAQDGAVRVADLVGRFDVHAATIRRDLKALEERRRKYWEAVTAVYAYSKEEAREKAKKEFKGVRG